MRLPEFCTVKVWLFLVFILLVHGCKKDPVEVEPEPELSYLEKLQALPNITIESIEAKDGYKMAFRIFMTQPLDHNNPSGITFEQEIILKHRDEALPVVFDTRGYSVNEEGVNQLTTLFPSNYLGVEHRYFAESRPDPLDWEYLTIRQAANDHHRIVDLFDEIYAGRWVNTGTSKGGMTALFHKRFFPEDVDATVAFVAPLITGLPDTRFNTFLTSGVGEASCRQAIETFQKAVLNRRKMMLQLFQEHEMEKNFTYSIGYEKVLELCTMEYQVSFWQYGWASCNQIPGINSTDEELFQHLIQVSPSWYYDDFAVDFFHPLFYQAYTELGYYYLVDDHLNGLIKALDAPNHRDLAPNVSMTYNPNVMKDVIEWLVSKGDNIIYIYGKDDPFTAAAIPDPTGTNSIKIIQSNANHSVTIDQLDAKELVYSSLEEWLDIDIQ